MSVTKNSSSTYVCLFSITLTDMPIQLPHDLPKLKPCTAIFSDEQTNCLETENVSIDFRGLVKVWLLIVPIASLIRAE